MDNINEEQKNSLKVSKRKGHGPVYWLIVVVGVAFIVAASFNIGMKVGKMVEGNETSKDDTSNQNSNVDSNSNADINSNLTSNVTSNVETQPKTVSKETLNYLMDILGINNSSESGDNWLLLNIYKVQGVLNEKLTTSDKHTITYLYADEHKMLTDINGTQYKYCANGNCKGILKTDFAKIAKLYGITDDPTTMFKSEQIYGNYYIYEPGLGGAISIKNTNIKAQYSGNDIIVTTDLTVSSPDSVSDKKAMTYTFKLNSENNYYLYAVSSK